MLDAAAHHCRRQGQRLLLVVDGVDEDRGTGSHSIAALLPARPREGLRIVIAGRHNPPLPSDVPADHPLRDPGVRRTLTASAHARGIQREAPLELRRLLLGPEAERELVGLVTAAGGGLSGRDLAELTGRQDMGSWLLVAHRGRTLVHEAAGRGPAGSTTAGEVYLLAHEELQEAAVHFLGGTQLAAYRQRLHDWAARWRRAGWSTQTPDYLLFGYFRMLHAQGESAHMTACALDPGRHRTLLDVTGGDGAALAEITAAQDALLGREPPDLDSMVLLAFRRDTLTHRNRRIPTRLPAVWGRLGHPLRAEAPRTDGYRSGPPCPRARRPERGTGRRRYGRPDGNRAGCDRGRCGGSRRRGRSRGPVRDRGGAARVNAGSSR